MTMNELWVRIKSICSKLWARTTRKIRVALALVVFLYVLTSQIDLPSFLAAALRKPVLTNHLQINIPEPLRRLHTEL